MEKKKKKILPKVSSPDFDMACSCGSAEIAGVCCKSNQLCPCGSGERAGECCYASNSDEEE